MPPRQVFVDHTKTEKNVSSQSKKYKNVIIWPKVIYFILSHLAAFYGLYGLIFLASWKTCFFLYFLIVLTGHGVGPGTHRLWAHRAYKAKVPLRILLMIDQTIAFQKPIIDWVKDHRAHHKYADTDFDPHNSKRGFFYSHMGWLMLRKSPEMVRKGKEIDVSDLKSDPVVMFQKKYYYTVLAPLIAFLIPAAIPWYFWNESFVTSFSVCSMLRICYALHVTCLVNSAAHKWGNKPYDKTILPVENLLVSYFSFGEGFHNFHHVFPWDYKAAELGDYGFNWNTAFIDFMAKIGWAYDLKSVSVDLLQKRIDRTGEGRKVLLKNVWGLEDKDMNSEDMKMVTVSHQKM